MTEQERVVAQVTFHLDQARAHLEAVQRILDVADPPPNLATRILRRRRSRR